MKRPHRLDAGKSRLRKLVATAEEIDPRIPLVHTTDAFHFEDILTEGVLKPQDCDTFDGEKLTYLFLGRPAFRSNSDNGPSSMRQFFPVCLIFDPNKMANMRRVFPFDSGAFNRELYASFTHPNMLLGDFRLEAHPSTPGKVVKMFFGSAGNYLRAQSDVARSLDPSEFEADVLLNLLNDKGSNSRDDRSTAVEVQLDKKIHLSSALLAVILPIGFVEGKTGLKLKEAGVEAIPYHIMNRSRPGEYVAVIYNECLNYYVRAGIIKRGDF